MTLSTSALDRLWHRNGGRGRTADPMHGSAWMRVHEASPALYLDRLGAVHGGPDADIAAAGPDADDPAGIMLGLVVVAHLVAAAAAGAALVFGAGWLAALLIHMAVGSAALPGAAVIVAQGDRVRRAARPSRALLRAG